MVLDQKVIRHILALSLPVLDRKHKFMFLANRKAGIHSVVRHLLPDRCVLKKDSQDEWAQLIRIYDITNVFKFTIVRNPWARCVSAFHALQQYSLKFEGLTFDKFVKTVLKRRGIKANRHFLYQYPSAFCNGRRIVNYIARLENIENDWPRIAEIIDCSPYLPHENVSNHRHYTEYYDENSREIVSRIYRKDIELFGYHFGE